MTSGFSSGSNDIHYVGSQLSETCAPWGVILTWEEPRGKNTVTRSIALYACIYDCVTSSELLKKEMLVRSCMALLLYGDA